MKRISIFLKIVCVTMWWGVTSCQPSSGSEAIRKVEKQSENAYEVEIPLLDTTEVTIVTN